MAAQGGYVIGTCVLLWWLSGEPRLSRKSQEQLRGARCLATAAQLACFFAERSVPMPSHGFIKTTSSWPAPQDELVAVRPKAPTDGVRVCYTSVLHRAVASQSGCSG
jgi:hypothetical protein